MKPHGEDKTTKTKQEAEGSHPVAPGEGGAHASGPRPRRGRGAPAYQADPTYKKLLEQFQNAEWGECQKSLERLLEAYPADQALLAFGQEVRTRSELQEHSERQRAADERARREAGRRRLLVGVVVGAVILVAGGWFINAYISADHRQKLAVAATQTAEALAAQQQAADAFMVAGQPEQALPLYTEIQKSNPAYPGIENAIQSAQLAIKVGRLYQQGVQADQQGDFNSALALLTQVKQLQPGYRDVDQLVGKIQRSQKEAALLSAMDNANAQGDSLGVVTNFEAIQAIDPNFDYSNMRDELFSSYSNLVLQISQEPAPKLDEVQAALKYYRAAVSLFPQSAQYARQQAELQDAAVGLLATQYSLQGIRTLEKADYSIQGLQASMLALQRAHQSAPAAASVAAALDTAQTFITSYDHLVHGEWDPAISGFEQIYRQQSDFANGRVRYFLYEAYTSRGDLLMLDGNFSGAFKDFQNAEKYAWEDQQNSMRVFQIEIRLGAAARKMSQYGQAAQFYHSGFAQVNYQARLTAPSQSALLKTLTDADAAFSQNSVFNAVNLYEQAVKQADQLYTESKVQVLGGDTLPSIAFDSGTTLWSLRDANPELGDSLIVSRSMQLSVPGLSPTQK